MGYTHYWYIHKPLDPKDLSAFLENARLLIANSPVQVVYDYDKPDLPPKTDGYIHLNGPEDYGHETFCFPDPWRTPGFPEYTRHEWQEQDGFNFCKTASKPYDIVVTALLLLACDHFNEEYLKIASDGDARDWEDGAILYRKTFQREPEGLSRLK